jgi:SMC interacting uncharacterized protein involved in chromosome segregation
MTEKPESKGNSVDVRKSIDSIFELTTRVDERVQGIVKQQLTLEAQVDRQFDIISAARENVHELELRLSNLEKSSTNQEQRWKTFFSFGIQLIWVILAAYLLYKLGIQSPDVP